MTERKGTEIRVRGQVQGVGFRPFVWRLARDRGLRGWVLNDAEGVLIRIWGETAGFTEALRDEAPPLARIDRIETREVTENPPDSFEIRASKGGVADTRVTPDAATCPDCLAEIRAPGRRHGYAFTNCTHCGPRFSILRGLPYDRAQTTMAGFALCPACRAEYEDPADRRFHAQPVACPACGPRLWFEAGGVELSGDPVALAVAALKRGEIVAVKGLGGFHLACDARDPEAVGRLRARKHRPAKPFALMAREADLDALVHVTPADLAALRSSAAPVVLMQARGALPEVVAPGIDTLGVMLPYTPLHHLLLDAFGGVLVMTSGNLSGEPQVIDNAEARAKLASFADGFLIHDRDIARRLEDSVLRCDPPMVLRHARGRVPGVIDLPEGFADAPEVLATGAQMKGAICLIRHGQAMLSHYLGDLDDPLCLSEFERAIADYRALFAHRTSHVAVDAHPGYRASQIGRDIAGREGLPVTEVWHHHAHMAACMAENGWPLRGAKVAGIVLDGTGLGPDGTLWGGELLLGDYRQAERIAHLAPAPLPGGDRAAREPWRNAVMRLDQAGLALPEHLAALPVQVIRAAARAGLNAPLSSSAGRLFDAAAAILGLCVQAQSYEGEAAMRLEALAGTAREAAEVEDQTDGPQIDPAPMLRMLCGPAPAAERARAVHLWLAQAFARRARRLIETGAAQAVALSGGCFQNALLLRLTLNELSGLPVLIQRETPANDGGLALGQALIASAQSM
ncbi:carbamoyltransferase HypF [Paenirhodobacter enshiensis]|uniref:carbamoyltransferase HypF n=1 Tax=Paenirhodobacter enshiensis TaxID=1105367 RepID=UPI0035B408D5